MAPRQVQNTVTRGQWLDSELNLRQRTDSLAPVQQRWTVSQTGVIFWQCWSPESLKAGVGGLGAWYQEAETYLMELSFTHRSEYVCVCWGEKQWQKKSRVNLTLKILHYGLQRRKTKYFIPFKKEWKENHRTLLVKCSHILCEHYCLMLV